MKLPESNPLLRELARSQTSGVHPEADILSAFAEGALPARERAGVMAHLAECRECRSVVALATAAAPVTDANAGVASLPKRTPRLAWLPWAATVAGVVVVAMVLTLYQPHQLSVGRPASVNEAAKIPAPAESQQALSPSPPTVAGTLPGKAPGAKQATPQPSKGTVTRFAAESQGAPAGVLGGSVSAPAPPAEDKIEIGGANAQRPVLQMQGEQSGAVVSGNSAGGGRTLSAYANSQGARASQAPASGPSNRSTNTQANSNQSANGLIAPRKAANEQVEVTGAAPPVAMAESTTPPTAMRKALASTPARPQWRITDSGRVERSFSAGSWQPMLSGESAKMRAVATVGSEVWAGGDNLRLYHSTDNGASWIPVRLPTKGTANQAITHIRFQTAYAGTVESDAGVTWTTTDGGATWK